MSKNDIANFVEGTDFDEKLEKKLKNKLLTWNKQMHKLKKN